MEGLVVLDAVEMRILGVLLEKEKTTPDYYPLTINGILTACNQKSSRNPVVNYNEETVKVGIEGLKKKGLANTVMGGGAKTIKYKHNALINLDLEKDEEAILCLLLLRGPLTAGELKTNSSRLFDFANLERVHKTIDSLLNKEIPLLIALPRLTGQKEGRYMHALGGEIDLEQYNEQGNQVVMEQRSHYEERLTALENEVAELKGVVDQLRALLD